MSSYNQPNTSPSTVTTTTGATAAPLLFTTRHLNAVGYGICNPSAVDVFVQERKAGDATVPTAAQVVASPSFIVPAKGDKTSGCRIGLVYVAAASAVDVVVQELL
jgi:hypothetical protein